MGELWFAQVKGHASVYQVLLAYLKRFFYPVNALEPYQLNGARCIADLCYQPLAPALTHGACAGKFTGYLYEFSIRMNFADETHLGAVNVAVREMFQQVPEGEDAEFFLQDIRPLR